ncbi:MAG: phosphonate metabolism protein/1,5-bisphosphokinase (PRPP-forming) PhnN [Pseudolabrys sp.]
MNALGTAPLPSSEPIGPGRLVLVVGPSGAGKDSVIAGAKALCARDGTIVFPRRIVTRPVTADEDHISVSQCGFDEALRGESFALWWQAHGLKYALPISIDADIRCGRTVVCNASRGIVEDARARYVNVTCVLITARVELLASRLEGRARDSDGAPEDRIERNAMYADLSTDIVIDNSGALHDAVDALTSTLRGAAAR